MTVALTRLPSLSRRQFQDYWLTQHGPLVRRLAGDLGILKYVQLHSDPEDSPLESPSAPAGLAPFDGLAQIWYESREAFGARMADPSRRDAARLLRRDERAFIDRDKTRLWWGLEHTIL